LIAGLFKSNSISISKIERGFSVIFKFLHQNPLGV